MFAAIALAFAKIPSVIKLAISAVVIAVLCTFGGYVYGRMVGAGNARLETLESSIEVLRQKGKIHDKMSSSDARALCRSFGLSNEQIRECVRRIGGPDTKP